MDEHPNYKWYILILSALTSTFVIGVPAVSLAVLFGEIIGDLHLNLVQVGLIWSIGSLPAIFTSPLSGAIIDRFGPKRVMLAGVFLVALTAGLRGVATSFGTLLGIIVVVGGLVPLVINSAYKLCGVWFPHQQLGRANSILSMGMGLGSLLGALLSATVVSPWLGGWRQVMFFYGVLAALFCIPWAYARPAPESDEGKPGRPAAIPMWQALTHIAKLKNIWLLGITLLGISGCMQGLSGYLSLYLKNLGWPAVQADGALSLISATGLIFILPIGWLSDRLSERKKMLFVVLPLMAVGTGLLSVASGWLVWAAIILTGMVNTGATALLLALVIETEGVGPLYAGTAVGFVMFFFQLGNFLSPPMGNQLADVAPGLPFLFWAGLVVIGILSLNFEKNATILREPQPEPQPL